MKKYFVDGFPLINLDELIGKKLEHKQPHLGILTVEKIKSEADNIYIHTHNHKKFRLESKFFKNLEIKDAPVQEKVLNSNNDFHIINPKIKNDVRKKSNGFNYYYNRDKELRFMDYYVPAFHKTREQVSLILKRDVSDFSKQVYKYKKKDIGFVDLETDLFIKASDEICDLSKDYKVIIVDLLGLPSIMPSNKNITYIDAKSKKSGDLIQRHTDEKVKKQTTERARHILKEKYQLNKQLSSITPNDIDYCYIFDDVYTKGNTTSHIKGLIREHSIKTPVFRTVVYAKTVRYHTNRFVFDKHPYKKKVLFVSKENKTRSLLAEAIGRFEFESRQKVYKFFSAGVEEYAGRLVSDCIYKYIKNYGLFDQNLKPQRLSKNEIENYKNGSLASYFDKIIVLDKSIVNIVYNLYKPKKTQLIVKPLRDICEDDNPDPKFYDVHWLSDKIRQIISEVV